jgi:hypothetical protein
MSVDRSELHSLVDKIPEADLPVTRKLLRALATDWDVAPAGSEGQLTDQARLDIEAAEAYFDNGGKGIAHKEILKEFDLT